MTDLETLHIESGLRDIPFGCKPDHVIQLLGDPDERETDEDGDLTLEYLELGLTFSFWADFNNGLGEIGTERTGALLCGFELSGDNQETIKAFIEQELNADISLEDSRVHEEGRVQSWIEVESKGITFWFDDGLLYLIDWTCQFDGDTPAWFRADSESESNGSAQEEETPSLAVATETPEVAEAQAPSPAPAMTQSENETAEKEKQPETPSNTDLKTKVTTLPDDVLECFEACYPNSPPIGFLLRKEYPELWLRIHSLPDSKRWPTEESEYQTLYRRHYKGAGEVLGEGSHCAVLLIAPAEVSAEELSALSGLGGRLHAYGAMDESLWTGKKGVFKEPMVLFGIGITWESGCYDAFIRATAENKIKAIVVELEEGCIYAPYDGGADLFYDTEEDRDAAQKRHHAWLPPRRTGK